MNINTFKFRPHHLICNLCFIGKGYNEKFIGNFTAIHERLNQNPDDAIIQIVGSCDDICTQCPSQKRGICCDEEKVAKIDVAYCKILQLQIGQIISLNTLKNTLQDRLTVKDFNKICSVCSWHSDICAPIISQKLQQ